MKLLVQTIQLTSAVAKLHTCILETHFCWPGQTNKVHLNVYYIDVVSCVPPWQSDTIWQEIMPLLKFHHNIR